MDACNDPPPPPLISGPPEETSETTIDPNHGDYFYEYDEDGNVIIPDAIDDEGFYTG